MSVLRERSDATLTLTIDRAEKRNALDADTLRGLVDGLHAADADAEVRVVVITGAGDRAFCAGADLADSFSDDAGGLARHEGLGHLRDVLGAIDTLGKPVVGRVNGHALAGGLGLALACDLLVAADHATFGTPEVKLGLWPFMISTLLVEHLGPKRARDLMLTGRRIDASQAEAWGLVNRAVPRADLDQAVREVVDRLVAGSPTAQRLGRRSLAEARDMTRPQALAYLHGMLDLSAQTQDVAEGLGAFFERRDPEWTGR